MPDDLSFATRAALALRYAYGLRGFLRQRPTRDACRALIRRDLEERDRNFLAVLERGVFANPQSPYRALFHHAGITLDDVRALLRREGLEGALSQLHDNGVHVRLEEFKGRVPIRRGSLELPVRTRDFDNPLSARHVPQATGGSRSGGIRVYVDLDHIARDAAYERELIETLDVFERPYAVWRPTPPHGAGFQTIMRFARLGLRTERWFAQNRLALLSRAWEHALLTRLTVLAGRLLGHPFPTPEHVPLDEAWRVAAWLATVRDRGNPGHLNTNVASGIRVCLAARARGLDISGSLFRVGGEPLTAARARIFAGAGCRVVAPYAMGELGIAALPCTSASAHDDLHLLADKLALIQPERQLASGAVVRTNVFTTLLATVPKLMLNVDTGDTATLELRSCGCPLDRLGYTTHLRDITSHEKLTSEGMNFLGHDLIRLMDEVLPARFGGHPTDYQMVEEDAGDLPRVSLVVSPKLGAIDETAVVDTVVRFLNTASGNGGDYGERWRDGRTLRVIRREPFATSSSKIQTLHVPPRGVPARR